MGDRDTDYVLDLVEKASQEAGLTIDQIKARRHIPFDHGDFVRPDQAERAAELGMIGGTWDFTLWESADQRFKDYGERGSSWHVPRKTMVSAGLMNTYEIDRPLGYTNLNGFTVLGAGLTRKGQDGRVYAPEERIDRQTMLKVATIWGAYYMLREDLLGSLEAGKFADFIVLDKGLYDNPRRSDQEHQGINGGVGRQDRSFSAITRPGNRDATCGRAGGAGWTGIAILKVINNSGAQYGCFPK